MELPDAIRHAVLFPESDQPGFPSGHPSRRFEVEGVSVVLPAGLPLGLVQPERIEESEIEHVVDSVRRLHRAEQRERALWFVSEAASPADLAERLLRLGMRPNDFPGADARSAQMVCLAAPPPGPPDVVARPGATFEEFLQARLVLADSIGLEEATRQTVMQEAERYWPFQSRPGAVDTFVALVDGEVVAYGGARFGRAAVYLAGGGPGRSTVDAAPTGRSCGLGGTPRSSEARRFSPWARARCRDRSSSDSASRSSVGRTAYSMRSTRPSPLRARASSAR